MRDEVTGEWRKLYNVELSNLYWSPIIVQVITSRRVRWAENVARMGERKGVNRVLVGRPEGKRPLRRHRRKWKDNIKMDFQEVCWGHGINLSDSGYSQVASTCTCGNEIRGIS
jgi:hypothetical protein